MFLTPNVKIVIMSYSMLLLRAIGLWLCFLLHTLPMS